MNWYLIALVVLGIVMGLAPNFVANNVKKFSKETDYFAKEKAQNRVSVWLYVFGLAIYISLALMAFQVCSILEDEIGELKSRIEVLEHQVPQIDTTTVDIRNI